MQTKLFMLSGLLSKIPPKYAFLLILFMMSAGQMQVLAVSSDQQQQQITVTGTVTDELGEPLLGLNVSIKGTSAGTITGADGTFSIRVSGGNAVLVFSYIGYATQEITVGTQRTLRITMLEDTQQIEQVVVTTGYATQKKATLTGAVSTISNKEIVVTKNENVVNMLSGKVPGVRISQRSSKPGEYNSVIDIRGYSTANNDGNNRTKPLFVIDGVPRDQDYFSRMNPEEIENISVLKDASAAIYGMRAANGVILVTTKSGTDKEGLVDVTYSGSFSWQQFIYVPDRLSPVEWYTLRNESSYKNLNYANFFGLNEPRHPESTIEPWRDGTYVASDWMGAVFNDLTPQSQHNVTVNGGSKSVKYFISMGYSEQEGAFKSGSLWSNKYNFRSNLDAQLTKRMKLRVAIGGIFDNTNSPVEADWTTYKNVLLQQPISTVYANNNPLYLNGDGQYISDENNSVAQTSGDISGERRNRGRRINGAFTFTYDIPGVKGLQARAFYDYSFYSPYNTEYRRAYTVYKYNSDTETYEPREKGGSNYNGKQTSYERRSTNYNYDTNMQLGLNYNNRFGDHSVNGVLVFEEQYGAWQDFNARRYITYTSVSSMGSGEQNQQEGSGSVPRDRASRALAGQFNYDYAGKYLLGVNFRYEGSSRWPKESRWGFFPSFSAGWRISEERFIKENFDFVSNIKLRGSYGQMGDDGGASDYPDIYSAFSVDGNYTVSWNDGIMQGARPTTLPNPKKTWYKVTMKNVGLDLGFLGNKFGGTFELFSRDRDGLLATSSAVVPGTVGANLPQENLNADRVYGWELELSHQSKIGDVGYSVSGQISGTQRKRTKWQEEPASHSYDHWRNRSEGRVTDIWWGRAAGGMFTNINDIRNFDQYPQSQSRLPGDWWFEDWNGDGIVNDDDRYPIASKNMPLFNYGISFGANWKGLDISVLFQGAQRVYTAFTEVYTEALPFGEKAGITQWLDRWRPEDVTGSWFSADTKWISGYYPVTGSNTRSIEQNNMLDASYMRLKNLELGYTLPRKLVSKLYLKDLRIYVSGYNLLTFTGLNKIDPERPSSEGGAGASTGGANSMYEYPNNRTFTVGLNVKF
jgi:TonB-linked SusC/RagA family outer membrane protein